MATTPPQHSSLAFSVTCSSTCSPTASSGKGELPVCLPLGGFSAPKKPLVGICVLNKYLSPSSSKPCLILQNAPPVATMHRSRFLDLSPLLRYLNNSACYCASVRDVSANACVNALLHIHIRHIPSNSRGCVAGSTVSVKGGMDYLARLFLRSGSMLVSPYLLPGFLLLDYHLAYDLTDKRCGKGDNFALLRLRGGGAFFPPDLAHTARVE